MKTKKRSEPDWFDVAVDRLEKLQCLQSQCANLRIGLETELRKEISVYLHAHSIPIRELQLNAIARGVAERITPRIP